MQSHYVWNKYQKSDNNRQNRRDEDARCHDVFYEPGIRMDLGFQHIRHPFHDCVKKFHNEDTHDYQEKHDRLSPSDLEINHSQSDQKSHKKLVLKILLMIYDIAQPPHGIGKAFRELSHPVHID